MNTGPAPNPGPASLAFPILPRLPSVRDSPIPPGRCAWGWGQLPQQLCLEEDSSLCIAQRLHVGEFSDSERPKTVQGHSTLGPLKSRFGTHCVPGPERTDWGFRLAPRGSS